MKKLLSLTASLVFFTSLLCSCSSDDDTPSERHLCSSSGEVTISSSSTVVANMPSSGAESSSSSIGETVVSSSSLAVVPSSSSAMLSSTSTITYTLTCADVPAQGTAGIKITPPVVACNGITVSDNWTWSGSAPNWYEPKVGTYSNISVFVSSGNCAGKYATCNGTLTVSAFSSSSSYNCSLNGRTVKIGEQVWMAENLNCDVTDSRCFNNDPVNCEIYGRLYNWAMAMDLPASCNNSSCSSKIDKKHRGICPSGWHIPSSSEIEELFIAVGGYKDLTFGSFINVGKQLKATSGWFDCGSSGSGYSYVCEDNYGFSAMPGGSSYGDFSDIGIHGDWWSSTESDRTFGTESDKPFVLGMGFFYRSDDADITIYNKGVFYSVRCLQD